MSLYNIESTVCLKTGETFEVKSEKSLAALWIWASKNNKEVIISIQNENLHISSASIAYIKEHN